MSMGAFALSGDRVDFDGQGEEQNLTETVRFLVLRHVGAVFEPH
jgi:hypothetical protein